LRQVRWSVATPDWQGWGLDFWADKESTKNLEESTRLSRPNQLRRNRVQSIQRILGSFGAPSLVHRTSVGHGAGLSDWICRLQVTTAACNFFERGLDSLDSLARLALQWI
jgi:hypothetical protein